MIIIVEFNKELLCDDGIVTVTDDSLWGGPKMKQNSSYILELYDLCASYVYMINWTMWHECMLNGDSFQFTFSAIKWNE